MSEKMQAAWYEDTGPAKRVLRTGITERPSPLPGEVLVRIHYSGVNPSDAKKRSGARGKMQFPIIIPHSDGAGIIEAVGEGVSSNRIDEHVWVWNAQWNRPLGTAAQYIALPERQAVPIPENFTLHGGACLGIPAMTAYVALDINHKIPLRPHLGHLQEQTILITGANGAVAHYAIGFAKGAGARVVTTASSPATIIDARDMGVDLITKHANFDPDKFRQEISDFTNGEGVDRIITSELGTLLDIVADILKPRGVVVAYGSEIVPTPALPFYALMFKNASLEFIFVYEIDEGLRQAAIQGINHHLARGNILPALDDIFPLEKIVQAHEQVESDKKFGVVLMGLP